MSVKFQAPSTFVRQAYQLLPFRFSLLESGNYFLSTDYGEWICLNPPQLSTLIKKEKIEDAMLWYELKAKHIVCQNIDNNQIALLASRYRTKKAFLENFSQLHIFVLTVRCNNSCVYCQASRKTCQSDQSRYDMSPAVLEKSIELFLSMPSDKLTLEFQGGESTLNMTLIRQAVSLVKSKGTKKDIQFVVCTNLCELNDDDLEFLLEHQFSISTSLDGPQELHDANRRYGNNGAWNALVATLDKIKRRKGFDRVSALMTTTRQSLEMPHEIIDEYVAQGFRSIFIRELNPYGFAQKYFHKVGYSTAQFLAFYEKCLDYIICLNRNGITFRESYASLIMKKLMTPWAAGFVDLQSPCGSGFGVTLYNYDGNIYPSDESRMMAEMGDQHFKMGNIFENSPEELFFGPVMQDLAAAGVNDCLPVCSDCAFAPYCGADPIRRYQVTGSTFGQPGKDEFCVKNRGIINMVIKRFTEGDNETRRLLMQWGMK
ncbi:His-Xaa-Ser system radical SAM maturase HxsB [Citrobacter braakii]|uniref:His-Xaa-Ser system radical SAM maturase HxsB n=1 Tax=Citrobacter TaxID=544 RepID=UPI0003309B6C|nr:MULTISPECIES: His-Xaa-Ser system radical SAM maturase HxsB [Citrobacter]EOQ48172.1 His-Xaa-Ser system radical SAM maturase HxsB [Citrobacter sp. KTE151]MDE9658065.1 His-Xaa-Ser system radical SAM maturase HxsB [Citrobacter braakii]MEC3927972.1 His-Xaa-Ser system radical SAM maturase HxsB [Citrobacter braakii]NCL81691.1 His-Xaa-Ser system radical SAM maturase HxsB [Citrobacter braakii]QLR23973.1 His-Xaa-Ser system radical SAM maturase HxsB [Citrobacter sp. RHBSTW-01013]